LASAIVTRPIELVRTAPYEGGRRRTRVTSPLNSGQVRIAIERVYAEAPVYDEFVAAARRRTTSRATSQDLHPIRRRCFSNHFTSLSIIVDSISAAESPALQQRRRRCAGGHWVSPPYESECVTLGGESPPVRQMRVRWNR
jgi:hypothetical protein